MLNYLSLIFSALCFKIHIETSDLLLYPRWTTDQKYTKGTQIQKNINVYNLYHGILQEEVSSLNLSFYFASKEERLLDLSSVEFIALFSFLMDTAAHRSQRKMVPSLFFVLQSILPYNSPFRSLLVLFITLLHWGSFTEEIFIILWYIKYCICTNFVV